MFTKENDIVLDPFIGSGSTAIACIQLNRRFIGFEIDQSYWELAQKRISKFINKPSHYQKELFLFDKKILLKGCENEYPS